MSGEPKITIKRAYKNGWVGISVSLRCNGYGDSVRVEGSLDVTTEQARGIAQALIAAADKEDVKIAAAKAAASRRQKWRDREIASGRLIEMSPKEFFQRGR